MFAGGGTGGHLFPAIAIAQEVKRRAPAADITFIGTRNKIEARVVPGNGFTFKTIWVSGFRRKLTLGNVLFPVKIVVSIVQSFFLMWKIRPNVVVGTGGYVCGPPLFAASVLGIPTLIQEQNSCPGVTTRLLASRANEVHLSFERSRSYFKRADNLHVSGNPTRESVGKISREEGRSYFNLQPDKQVLLVFGGSLGASSINNAVMKMLDGIIERGIQLVWQTGENDYERLAVKLKPSAGTSSGSILLRSFVDRMEYAYAACDLAVCRAGATTLAELAKAGVVSVLVPYPHAAADHQTENARAMVEAGAAVMIKDADLNEKLISTVQTLLADKQRLEAMREKARQMGKHDAAAVIARAVVNLAGAAHGRS